MSRAAALVLAAALTLGACSANASPSAGPQSASDRDGPYLLTVSMSRSTWRAGDPIDLRASLEYQGVVAQHVGGSGGGLISFALKELSGTREIEPVVTSDCAFYELASFSPITTGFVKSGSLEEPNAEWKRDFFNDRVFRLPAGRWRVTAHAAFVEEDCSGRAHDLEASVEFSVT